MRVAMGLALEEIDREARAIEFYEILSSFDFMSSTPTLFNSGTLRSLMDLFLLQYVLHTGTNKSVRKSSLSSFSFSLLFVSVCVSFFLSVCM